MNTSRVCTFLLFGCLLALAACTSAAPRVIGVYPSAALTRTPIAQFPRTQPPTPVPVEPSGPLPAYYASLSVYTQDAAAGLGDARRTIAARGGSVVSEHAWTAGDITGSTLVFDLPYEQADSTRQALHALGQVSSESYTQPGDLAYQHASRAWITLQLYTAIVPAPTPMPVAARSPAAPAGWPWNWNPLRTLGQAFVVFFSIFASLTDVLIWAVMVAGPFAALVLIVRAWWRGRKGDGVTG